MFLFGNNNEAIILKLNIAIIIINECIVSNPIECNQSCANIFTPMKVNKNDKPIFK